MDDELGGKLVCSIVLAASINRSIALSGVACGNLLPVSNVPLLQTQSDLWHLSYHYDDALAYLERCIELVGSFRSESVAALQEMITKLILDGSARVLRKGLERPASVNERLIR